MEPLEGFDEQEVGSEPDGSSPIRVASEHAAFGVSGPVFDTEVLTVHVHGERFILVV